MTQDSYGLQPRQDAPASGGVTRSLSPMPERTDILSTARNPHSGGPVASVNDSSLVEHGGMQMTAREAASLGILQRDAQGNYSEPQRGQPQEQPQGQQQEPQAQEDGPVPFAAEDEAMATEFASRVPGPIQEALISQVLASGLEGIDPAAASAVGMSPEEMQAGVQGVVAGFQKQADEYVTKRGAAPQEFYEWAREEALDDLREAMRVHCYSRNPGKAYDSLVARYFRTVPPTRQAIEAGGHKVQTLPNGENLVTINGTTTTAATAARLGLI